jgi:hemerythrin-like domain-containing protein
MNDTATGVLRAEHQLILEVASVLERAIDGGGTDGEALGDSVAFFRLFADACHHGKEEDLLFPALQAEGMPAEVGPIAVMLEEHRIGREFVGRMAESLPAAETAAGAEFTDAARGYIDLIRAHIAKEAACKELCSRYDEVCARRFEGRTLEELEGLAESLRGRYPFV